MNIFSRLFLLATHEGFLRYAKNTSWLMGEQLLRLLSGLFVGVWVARYLGPEQFGIFSYVLAFTSIFAGIAKLGLDGVVIRALVTYPNQRNIYLGTAFWLKITTAIFVLALVVAISFSIGNSTLINVYILIISSGLIFQSFEVIEFHFQSQVLGKVISLCKIMQLALSAAVKIYLIYIRAELIWFVLATFFDTLTLAVSYGISYYKYNISTFLRSFDVQTARHLLKDSWPLILTSVAVSIHMKIDQVMIKGMLGVGAVGQYSAAVRISESWYFVPMIIASSTFPAIVNAKKYNEKLYNERLQNLFTLMMWLALLVAILTTFLSGWIIDTLFGKSYSQSASVLTVHIWTGIAVSFGIVWSRWILAENQQRLAVIFHVLSMVLNIVLNLLLIPFAGILGAAMATAIASTLSQVLGIMFFKRDKAVYFFVRATFPRYLIEGKNENYT